MAATDSDSSLFVVFDLVRAFRSRFEEAVSASPVAVTPAESRVLLDLTKHGPSRQAEIGERLAIGAMSVTGLVDRLEKAGFVRREADPEDRRAKCIHLTTASAPVLEEIQRVKSALRDRATRNIDPADYEIYTRVIRQMRANLADSRCSENAPQSIGKSETRNA
ncbi:MarR family winged helix-turn-helix transcriptional regulator [Notoacmeibacter sp. MSK16QG-6]|uniref:MarR family winged helix-turn-helix transcriptional regulator n=1 Tax=Notoacmeibacter sp. MSK16QG-6 TaxID=2957982 RepID=UPI00209D8C77|nr:MarR family transcriptional regulator [Notoacmeibacter sp. MSK16QG-6]MCP1199148.1 MarR family transcriptional regulator [Notoacmeibacter sp. MSK16QG-6]